MADRYDYQPRVLTEDRLRVITELIEGMRDDAAHDIEDKRDVYEALVDLLAAVNR